MAARTRPTRDQTRDRILHSANELFISQGFDSTSIDQIAAAAGLTKGAVYSSFKSKDDLFFSLVGARLHERLGAVTGWEGRSGDLADQFLEAEEELADLIRSQQDWQILFIECWVRAVRDSGRLEQWTQQRQEIKRIITEFFQRHADAGTATLKFPATDLATIAVSLSNGLAMEYVADPESTDPRLFARVLSGLVQS